MLLINNQPINYFTFPGGEIQVQLPENINHERVRLLWKPQNAADITLLQLTFNALRNNGISDIDLDILYLPYARQDRICSPGQAFSLEVICDLLKLLDPTIIRLWDVHNRKLTINLLEDNCYIWHVDVYEIFEQFKILDHFDLYNLRICAPDQGAVDRVTSITQKIDFLFNIHFCKKRNIETGEIIGLEPHPNSLDWDGYSILVVDDICDGGSTFINLAKELRKNTQEDLYLYVTHGIFSKGLEPLLEHYKHIYCHHVLDDSKYQSNEHLTILREFPHAR